MALKLLIFDLDGTLVDSSGDITAALNYAFKPYGIGELTVAQTIALVGEGATALIGKVIEQKGLGLDVATLLPRFLEYYAGHVRDHSVPYPGTEETLDALAPFGKAVVSNKLEAFSVKLLEELGLLRHFSYVSGSDTGPEKKPSPVPVLNVLARFDTLPAEALFIGDSVYDMRAARGAGVRGVAALYGYGPPGFSECADFTISCMADLVPLVGRLS